MSEAPATLRDVVDELTDEAGLVTSAMVPALRAVEGTTVRGGLELAG